MGLQFVGAARDAACVAEQLIFQGLPRLLAFRRRAATAPPSSM
jgi:hypothetical protein